MEMTRRVRVGLLVIAVALLITGLAGPVRRAWDDHARTAAAKALAEQVARERAAAAAALAANRTEILARLRAQLESGDFAGAMTAAGAYLQAGDPEIRQLFTQAATAESQRQRTDHYRALVERDCTEANVRAQMAKLLAPSGNPAAETVAEPPLRLTRLAGATARDPVQARLREPPDHEHEGSKGEHSAATKADDHAGAAKTGDRARAKPHDQAEHEKADWITRLREENRARPLPDYVAILDTPKADEMICVWRVDGTRSEGSRNLRYTMDVWLAPTPDGKRLAADPLAYSERPL